MKAAVVSKLTVLEELAADPTLVDFAGIPIASGNGDLNFVCGGCEALLVQGLTVTDAALQQQLQKLVIKCLCGTYNSFSAKERVSELAVQSSDMGHIDVVSVDRDRLVAEAAYYRAEKRGFAPGYALEDWLAAEAQVDHESG